MRLQIRVFGWEIVGLDYDPPAVVVGPSVVAEPEPGPEVVQPQIPAGFGFHGSSGGSQERFGEYDLRHGPVKVPVNGSGEVL